MNSAESTSKQPPANSGADRAAAGAEDRRQSGPVTRSGPSSLDTTTDQRLLESRGPADWVHTDNTAPINNVKRGTASSTA